MIATSSKYALFSPPPITAAPSTPQPPISKTLTVPRRNTNNNPPNGLTKSSSAGKKIAASSSVRSWEAETADNTTRPRSSGASATGKKCPTTNNNSATRNQQQQSVPFLQRKFNLFGSYSSATLGKSTTVKEPSTSTTTASKAAAATLPRSTKTSSFRTKNPPASVQRNSSKVKRESPAGESEKSLSSSLDTFKGVQSLKQFWNSRIIGNSSASGNHNKCSATAASNVGQTGSAGVVKSKSRKSGSGDAAEKPSPATPAVCNIAKRRGSEERSSVVKRKPDGDDISSAASNTKGDSAVTLRQSSFAKSDNFNKYKTASSVKLHRVSHSDLGGRQSSVRGSGRQKTTDPKRHTVDSVAVNSICIPRTSKATTATLSRSSSAAANTLSAVAATPVGVTTTAAAATAPVSHHRGTLKFPQIATTATGAKIHWPKREDILDKNKRRSLDSNTTTAAAVTITMIKDTEAKESSSSPPLGKKNLITKKTEMNFNPPREAKIDQMDSLADSSPTVTTDTNLANSSSTSSSPAKGQGSRSTTPSSISLTSNTMSSSGRTESPRKGATTRRPSFKTHSGQSQSIRKLATVASSGGLAGTGNSSKVAALTQRFNQLIQSDATLLEEVKRKGGVVVHRTNGHVYKIKEDTGGSTVPEENVISSGGGGGAKQRRSLSRNPSSAIDQNTDTPTHSRHGLRRRKSSVKKQHDMLRKSTSSNSSNGGGGAAGEDKKGVRATIQLFEPAAENNSSSATVASQSLIKPKVPDKSEQVLKRTKELVISHRREVPSRLLLEESSPSRMSLKLDEIKEVLEEKTLTPIQEALPPVPDTAPPSPPPTAPKPDKVNSSALYVRTGDQSAIKKDKSVYGRIYEKLKINRSSFLYSKKTPPVGSQMTSPTLQISPPVLRSSTYDLRDPIPLEVATHSPAAVQQPPPPPEQKIFEALASVDRRIENLCRSSIELNGNEEASAALDNLKPNQSFLFRSQTKNSSPSSPLNSPIMGHQSSMDLRATSSTRGEGPCEAFNVGLIKNKTMSMDERNFPFTYWTTDEDRRSQLSVSSSDLFEIVPLRTEDDPSGDGQSGHHNIRNEYRDIINETDKLIRRMNETYGSGEFIDEDDQQQREDQQPTEPTIIVNSPVEVGHPPPMENNYELYEQIASEVGENVAKIATSTARDEDNSAEESIYQTVAEVKSAIREAFIGQQHDGASVNSYESCDNYEAIDELRRSYREDQKGAKGGKAATGGGSSPDSHGYEICEPPEPPPPRKISAVTTPNELPALPALPVPKRNKGPVQPVPKSIFYTDESPAETQIVPAATKKPAGHDHRSDIFHSEYVYEENIYDTIKSADNTSLLSNNYESISLMGRAGVLDLDSKLKAGDTISYTSNCYESLRGSTLTINHLNNPGLNKYAKPDYFGLRHSESVSTLSSDHKTNSIYGTTIHYGGSIAAHPGDRNSVATSGGGSPLSTDNEAAYTKMKHPPSENGTSYSENSDEWVDISDGEEDGAMDGEADRQPGSAKHKIIIIRERAKNHRSTTSDWNAKIREQRIQQIQSHSHYYDDDSDHHYESMYAGNYENQEAAQCPAPPNVDIIPFDDEEFDSFDSELETDEDVKKNDSGVDVSNTRLPDPPPSSSNQVYALMQKFKTLSSLSEISKSLSRFATKKRSKRNGDQKYENLTESSANLYQYQGVTKGKAQKAKNKGSVTVNTTTALGNSQFYENTDFHSPRTPTAISGGPVNALLLTSTPVHEGPSSSSPSAASAPATKEVADSPSFGEYTGAGSQQIPVPLARKKSKAGKSFKSKLRRSLVPDTTNLSSFTTKSTFYVNDTPDMDSGIFTGSDKTLKMDESSRSSIKLDTSFTDLVNEIKTRNAKNNGSSNEDIRRRSIATTRPLSPPPAPPVILTTPPNGEKRPLPAIGGEGKRATANPKSMTSWYDECGLFKADHVKEMEKKASLTNWYADSGLYQTSGDSVASSSGSSGVSTGGECNGQDDNSHSLFCNEPLYQIYSAAKLESITRDMEMETDGYEEIGKLLPAEGANKKPVRPTALQLVSPRQGPSRTLWSEIPEVINSEILSTLTPTEKRIQEAKFEIITSEASYLKSLNLLKSHFMNHPAFRDVTVLSAADRKTLFSYTIPVLECSEKLLTDLENCWQDNIMLIGLSHSIFKHAECSFRVYVNYCEHQVRLDRILKKLKESNKKFCEVLEQLEADPVCCGLSFHSFLMLPMQRITRLPLLIDAVLSKLKADDDEYENWKMTLAILSKIVSQCNEAAHKCEQVYEMQYISRQIEFPSDISPLPIVPMGIPAPNSRRRALVRRGELVHLIWRGDDGKLTFGKKFSKSSVYVFLFTDLLVLTKKKSDDSYLVFDYCCRSMLTVSSGDVIPQLPTKDLAMAGKHLILMTLLENHQGKTVELILSCESETDRTRWLKATEPPLSENPDETLYEQWDCPQVTVLHAYQATQPDELSLDIGDVVNVTRKMADGWYHGERMRDGAQGWFPGNYAEEVASPHVRARNLKQRYRLLAFTATYLESQKKK